jgi:predicted PurR-regulated permease PerM
MGHTNMVENDSRVNTDLVIKLFDTLKESDSSLRYQVDKQTDAIVSLSNAVSAIKANSPKIDTIQNDAENTRKNTKSILEIVTGMSKSVKTMIIVVSVAFGLMTLAYFFVKSNVESMIDKKLQTTTELIEENKGLLEQIESLKNQLKNDKREKQ